MTSQHKQRIAFVINSLGPGGAERVLEQVMRMAPSSAWDCHLILLDAEKEWRTPPDFVTIHRLDSRRSLRAGIGLLKSALAAIAPQLVVSFLVRANVASVIACRLLGIPCIISERSQLSTHLENEHSGLRLRAAKLAPRLTYPRATHVISVSDGVRTDLIRKFGVRPGRVATIYNPYDLSRIRQAAVQAPEYPLPERFLVSAGRLVKRKGFDDLLMAYAQARSDLPLCILGDGEERQALTHRAAAMGLADRVHFLGYALNPFAIVARAEMFVSPSHCEGFPNALAEAMALGIPVVSTDCPSGPAELLDGVETVGINGVHNGKYGLLTPVSRPDLLAKAIDMMNGQATRQHYAAAARARMQDFTIEAISDQYWTLFGKTVTPRINSDGEKSRRPPHAAVALPE